MGDRIQLPESLDWRRVSIVESVSKARIISSNRRHQHRNLLKSRTLTVETFPFVRTIFFPNGQGKRGGGNVDWLRNALASRNRILFSSPPFPFSLRLGPTKHISHPPTLYTHRRPRMRKQTASLGARRPPPMPNDDDHPPTRRRRRSCAGRGSGRSGSGSRRRRRR